MSFEVHKQQVHFLWTHEWKNHTSTSVSRIVKLCKRSMTKDREMISIRKKERNNKLAKSKTWKGGLSQKWASRWIENPKWAIQTKIRGIKERIYSRRIENPKWRSRQKLGFQNNDERKKNIWRLLPMFWLRATSSGGLIDGEFCQNMICYPVHWFN